MCKDYGYSKNKKMNISVIIEDVIFRNENNGYTVLSTVHNDENIIVVGCFPNFRKGEIVEFTGGFIEHVRYGEQFSATDFNIKLPNSSTEVFQFLASGIIKGIGNATAKLIVDTFGENTLNILDCAPYRLTEVKGIGDKKAAQIIDSYNEIIGIRSILLKLQSYGFSPKESIRISNFYGMDTIEILNNNPYILIDEVDGIGFITADKIAIKIGFAKDSDFRIQSGILYFLKTMAVNFGHTAYPQTKLIKEAASLLDIEDIQIEQGLSKLILKGKIKLIEDSEVFLVTLPYYLNLEKKVAMKLKDLLHYNPHEDNIQFSLKMQDVQLNAQQVIAIETAVHQNVSIITGGPGTGKTTILGNIISIFNSKRIALCAPTGRAAKRMQESTGVASYTIHKLLEYGQDENLFNRNEENLLEFDVVIVDEFSMVDISLFYHLLEAVAFGTKLILIGDSDQLPSVGPGNVLSDLIQSNQFPITRLSEVYRQKEDSQIITNSVLIKNGNMPVLNAEHGNFYFISENNANKSAEIIVDLMLKRLPNYLGYAEPQEIIKSIQLLSPMKKGVCGTLEINRRIQERIISDQNEEIVYAGNSYFTGDKIIQIKNDYNVEYEDLTTKLKYKGLFNGEIGVITSINDGTATILFDESKIVRYTSSNFENVSLAYCLTVHKSQGSEFPVIIIPLVYGPKMLLTRNLLYTAITRASSTVVMIGDINVLQQMIENNYIAKRYTLLKKNLIHYFH